MTPTRAFAAQPLESALASSPLDAWQALLAGRYRILCWYDRRQRRQLVLGPVLTRRYRPLTPRQTRMLALRARGSALKVIAFDLGLSVPAVSQSLALTLQQLGLPSTAALIAVFGAAASPPSDEARPELVPHPELRLERAESEVEGTLVLSFPLPTDAGLLTCLSRAEGEVVEGLLRGLSNAEVAALRGVSHRTVANQIAAVFAKLRVSSRLELVRHVLGSQYASPALAGAVA